MKKIIFIVLLAAVLVYLFYPEKVITYPPGVTAPDQPIQSSLNEQKSWSVDEYSFEALAEYKIKARVLSRNNFSLGKESDLSPLDLALGWGRMSDQNIIDQLDISQSNRWYRWQAEALPIPANEIISSSANVHIVPMDESVKNKFDEVYKGSLIEMKGYLVKINGPSGWHWVSSTRRDDTGGGSCELFWVEDVVVLDEMN